MKKEFKKCGSGDNVCNCNSADECGYSIPYENTTKKSLPEFLDEVSKKYGYKSFEDLDDKNTFSYDHDTPKIMIEAAELYASQFVKKDSVISDVEHKFEYFPNHGDETGRNEWTVCYGEDNEIIITAEDTEEDAQEVCRRLNKILFEQSTQQPAASFDWFNDDQIAELVAEFEIGGQKAFKVFRDFQSKLKERVNCVDPAISIEEAKELLVSWLCDEYSTSEAENQIKNATLKISGNKITVTYQNNVVENVEVFTVKKIRHSK